jgi:hypothetical protein
MDTNQLNAPNRRITINSLAVIGFIALVAAGMWLAVYSARFVPTVVNRISLAAVYVGSIFNPADKPALSVISTPVSSTTIFFGETSPTNATQPAPISQTGSKPATNPGKATNTTHQISGATSTNVFHGMPDFVIIINSVGYLASTTADSFVATSTMYSNNRPAVKFTIRNNGTNVSGPWRFSASIPTQTSYIYQSPQQQSLSPGDSIEYTLGFDQPIAGVNKIISVTANFDHAISESDFNNNSASASITIIGS